ncbi:hypothetical protein FHS26_003275 [Rhizobium pisi]|uniref:Uncharacterized protein n=1 Tax=Rhizobium pisi TaxID=574561 RepID=A0A7W5G0C7_9HYPH|nr:hypothetical protein [Rhizobium pisi]
MISTFTAFFDANVFYGARLRSLVLHLAQSKLFRARWWMPCTMNGWQISSRTVPT